MLRALAAAIPEIKPQNSIKWVQRWESEGRHNEARLQTLATGSTAAIQRCRRRDTTRYFGTGDKAPFALCMVRVLAELGGKYHYFVSKWGLYKGLGLRDNFFPPLPHRGIHATVPSFILTLLDASFSSSLMGRRGSSWTTANASLPTSAFRCCTASCSSSLDFSCRRLQLMGVTPGVGYDLWLDMGEGFGGF